MEKFEPLIIIEGDVSYYDLSGLIILKWIERELYPQHLIL